MRQALREYLSAYAEQVRADTVVELAIRAGRTPTDDERERADDARDAADQAWSDWRDDG